jgi:hypothetical protein
MNIEIDTVPNLIAEPHSLSFQLRPGAGQPRATTSTRSKSELIPSWRYGIRQSEYAASTHSEAKFAAGDRLTH